MDARQLTSLCSVKSARSFAMLVCAAALCTAQTRADELKLPETPDQYRKLLQESSTHDNEGRSGRIYRITTVATAVKGKPTEPNATVGNAVGGSPGVQPVPLIGKNIKNETAKQNDSSETRYQIAVQWADGSFGLFEQARLGGLREGDAVIVRGRTVERDPSR